MSIKYEILIITVLVVATLGTARALESGTVDLPQFSQIVLNRG